MPLRPFFIALLVAAATLASPVARAAEARLAALAVTLPDGWRLQESSESDTLLFGPAQGSDFSAALTTYPEYNKPAAYDAEVLHTFSEQQVESFANQLQEKDLPLKEFKSGTAHGFFFEGTDANPNLPPGEFRYMTRGVMLVGQAFYIFTILSNEKSGKAQAQGLAMLRGAHSAP